MGLIITDKSIDDSYSAEVIQKARDLSPEIDEYIVTQQYLLETVEENLSPAWLRNKVLCIILDQLNDRGVKFNMAESMALDDPEAVAVILYLRSKCDQDNIYELFKDHQDIANFVREINDDADCLDDIIAYCASILPLDEGWDNLNRFATSKPGVIESTSDFVDILNRALDKLDALGEPSIITPHNENVVESFIGFLGKRKQSIANIAKTIYSTTEVATENNLGELKEVGVKALAVDGFMQSFERELARPAVVGALDPEVHDINLTDVRAKFVSKWQHTLEYWLEPANAEKIPSELTFAVMIATMYQDFGAKPQARAKIVGRFEDAVDLLGPRYDKFREMLDNALANFATFQESEVM